MTKAAAVESAVALKTKEVELLHKTIEGLRGEVAAANKDVRSAWREGYRDGLREGKVEAQAEAEAMAKRVAAAAAQAALSSMS